MSVPRPPSDSSSRRHAIRMVTLLVGLTGLALATTVTAGEQFARDTTVIAVSVNGGADTLNAGTSCLRVAAPLPAACTFGYIAIPNNNKQMLAAALAAKTSGANVLVYFFDSAQGHCPGLAMTSCSLATLEVR